MYGTHKALNFSNKLKSTHECQHATTMRERKTSLMKWRRKKKYLLYEMVKFSNTKDNGKSLLFVYLVERRHTDAHELRMWLLANICTLYHDETVVK